MEDFKDCHDVSKPIEAPPKLEEEPQYITLQDLINLAIENDVDFKNPITALEGDEGEYARLFTTAIVNKGKGENCTPLIELM